MLYLVTGTPGSGKTLRAVSWVEPWLSEGRPVYTNIDGLAMNVEPLPDSWQDAPDGAVVVFDEAQQFFPSTGRAGVAESEDVRALETHRHRGIDLLFITQHPNLIHHHIRKLVGHHEHIERIFGSQSATVFRWQQAADIADKSARSNADKVTWRFPRRLYSAYQSATVHTHKFTIPRKLVFIGVVIAGLAGLSVYGYLQSDLLSGDSVSGDADSGASESSSESSLSSAGEASAETSAASSGEVRELLGDPQRLDGVEWNTAGRYLGYAAGCAHVLFEFGEIRACGSDSDWSLIERSDSYAVVRTPFGEEHLFARAAGPEPDEGLHASQQDWYQTASNNTAGGSSYGSRNNDARRDDDGDDEGGASPFD